MSGTTKKGFWKKPWVWVLVILLIAGIAGTSGCNGSQGATEPVKNKPTITMAEFDQLKSGMTYEEATQIIGGPGKVLSENGNKGDKLHTIMYQYEGEGSLGANANLLFQDNKLQNKAQMGLK